MVRQSRLLSEIKPQISQVSRPIMPYLRWEWPEACVGMASPWVHKVRQGANQRTVSAEVIERHGVIE